ncbi:MAG: alpha/beta fold hydrolase, partial [Lapillicoccus sp.]
TADVMAALRHALTTYMVPSGMVSLPRFPLTSSGKLDESALPPWTPSVPSARPGAHLSEDEQIVASLISDVLRLDSPIGPSDDFIDDLGGTSLDIVHLLAAMEETFDCRLQIDRVVADTTLAGLAGLVGSAGSGADPRPARMIMHGAGLKPPLFLFHAYLGGVLRYRRLEPFLSPDRPLIAIYACHQDGAESATTIEDMADRVLAEVRAVQPTGPYLIGGHSAGGLIAYDVARKMVGMGEQVGKLIILDSPVSSPRWRYYWAEALLNWPEIRDASMAERVARIRRAVRSRLSLYRRGPVRDRVAVAIEKANRLSNLACLHYVTPRYSGDMCLFRSAQGIRMAAGDRSLGWDQHVDGVITYVDLVGGHTTMFEPAYVASLAGKLNEVLGAEEAIAPVPGQV